MEAEVTAVFLTIHRAAHEIGGNCIEIATSDGHRLILDAGRPLDVPEDVKDGLLPSTLDTKAPVDGLGCVDIYLIHRMIAARVTIAR
jgi:hypothetical protein